MALRYIDTQISLPLEHLGRDRVRELLDMVLRRFRWFEPRRYGHASLGYRLEPGHVELDALVAEYEEHGNLCVASKTNRDYLWLHPTLLTPPIHTGSITWLTPASVASTDEWREAHASQVAEVMRLVESPLALCALKEDLHRKKWRIVNRGSFQEEVPTVRDYTEGLPGLFWRNFYGLPFVHLFQEQLTALPTDALRRFGGEFALVQPYMLPTEAGSPEASEREAHMVSLLGADCFYDQTKHLPPARRPLLTPPREHLH